MKRVRKILPAFCCYSGNIDKAPCEAPVMHAGLCAQEPARSVLHTFTLGVSLASHRGVRAFVKSESR